MASFARIYFDYKIETEGGGIYKIIKGEGKMRSPRIVRRGIVGKDQADRLLKLAKRHRW